VFREIRSARWGRRAAAGETSWELVTSGVVVEVNSSSNAWVGFAVPACCLAKRTRGGGEIPGDVATM
jgi:hypothetical protein